MPNEIKLEHPLPGEEVIIVIRRHWIVYAFIGLYFLSAFVITGTLLTFFFSKPWVYLLLVMFRMIFLLFTYVKWLDHELDLFVITNSRVIGIEQVSLLNRTVSECSLAQVQEVGSKTQGFFANVLNYGTITIQTAGNATNFIMEYAPDAIDTSSKIHNIINSYRTVVMKKNEKGVLEAGINKKVEDIIPK